MAQKERVAPVAVITGASSGLGRYLRELPLVKVIGRCW